jgi:hypothetical protein
MHDIFIVQIFVPLQVESLMCTRVWVFRHLPGRWGKRKKTPFMRFFQPLTRVCDS